MLWLFGVICWDTDFVHGQRPLGVDTSEFSGTSGNVESMQYLLWLVFRFVLRRLADRLGLGSASEARLDRGSEEMGSSKLG